MSAIAGKVYLVGAGPGAVDLITVAGAEALRRADAVVYDHLINPDLLRLAPAGAALISAGKRAGDEASIEQSEVNRILIEQARAGRQVVRLKGGDPFIFGRGGEEAAALADAGISFEVIPGVTSAIAVPAFAGIPLTHREHGSFVAFITGHEDDSKGALLTPWAELAAAARNRGTLVLMMAGARLRANIDWLITAGLSPDTPAAAIQSGTTADQRTVTAALERLADEVRDAGLQPPMIVVIGECAAMRGQLRWFEQLPLFGQRILITRAARRAESFARMLRELGAEAIEFPTIQIAPPDSFDQLDNALSRPGAFDWIIFTSATGVESFIARLRSIGRDLRELGRASIAAIGPATAAAVGRYALKVVAVPAEYRAEAIADAIGDERIRGSSFLIPRAQVAREALPELLRAKGAREVLVAPAYKTIKPEAAAIERVRGLIASRSIRLVAFTSSSTVTNFCDLLGDAARTVKAAAIGPITAETARKAGFDVVAMPAEYTIAALAAAIRGYFQARRAV